MYRVMLMSVLIALASASRVAAQDEVNFKETTVAQFRYGDARYSVHPMLGNAVSSPERWLFRYEPLFAAEVDQQKRLAIRINQVDKVWVLSLAIALSAPDADRAAYTSIQNAYPTEAAKIQPLNVSHMRPTNLKLIIPFPQAMGGPVQQAINPGAAPVITMTVEVNDKDMATRMESWLRGDQGRIEFEYTYRTRKTSANVFQVKMSTLANSTLEAELNNPRKVQVNGDHVYVHRNDLRRLCQNAHRQIQITGIIEDPGHFSEDLAKGLLNLWSQTETLEFASWGRDRWQSTYHSDDFKPDRIEKHINKVFQKVEGKDEYRYDRKEHGSGSGGFSLVGIVTIGGSGESNNAISQSGVKEYLRENNLECEIEGNVIVPKRLIVQRVNTADFRSDFQVTDARIYVGENRDESNKVDVQLARSITDNRLFKTVDGRLADLEERVPLGMMLPYFGKDLPSGFVWANGKSTWPKAGWVAEHLRGKSIPDMDRQMLGGTTVEGNVGTVWDRGVVKGDAFSISSNAKVLIDPNFPKQALMGLVNPKGMEKQFIGPNSLTYTNLQIIPYGDDQGRITVPSMMLNTADNNPRHLVCRWIIRVE